MRSSQFLRIARNFHRLVARGQHADVGYVGRPYYGPRRAQANVGSWPIATLPQEFMSAMPPKADKPEPTRMTQTGLRLMHLVVAKLHLLSSPETLRDGKFGAPLARN